MSQLLTGVPSSEGRWKMCPMVRHKVVLPTSDLLLKTIDDQYRKFGNLSMEKRYKTMVLYDGKATPIHLETIKKKKIEKFFSYKVKPVNKDNTIFSFESKSVPFKGNVEEFVELHQNIEEGNWNSLSTEGKVNSILDSFKVGSEFSYKVDLGMATLKRSSSGEFQIDHVGKGPLDLTTFRSPLNFTDGKDVMDGINTPYFLIGVKGSGGVYHFEDNNLGSINVLHFGDSNKMWIIVDPNDNDKFLQKVHSELNLPQGSESCFLRGKNYFISPEFLIKHGIRYKTIIQKVGDVVVLLPGVIHGVMNLGVCINSAINFMPISEEMMDPIKEFVPCQCNKKDFLPTGKRTTSPAHQKVHGQDLTHLLGEYEKTKRSYILETFSKLVAPPFVPPPSYPCEVCGKLLQNKKSLTKHRGIHDPERTLHKCDHCPATFTTVFQLKAHIERMSTEPSNETTKRKRVCNPKE